MKITKMLLGIIAGITLAACGGGGGGGGGGSSPADITLSGIAATGHPIVNGTIQIICAGGSTLNTTTNSTGVWQVTISGQTLPCAVEISDGTINGVPNVIPYHSIATRFGNVNITPLTDLMLANLAGTATPNIWFAGLVPTSLTPITSNAVTAALRNQCTALSGLSLLCATNPVTTVFTPTNDNIMDYMLIALKVAMINSGTTYASLLSDASAATYNAPATNFGTALTDAYIATTAAISASAISTTQSLTVGTAMTAFSPIIPIGGTQPYTYSYTGTLPASLSFNTSIGVVTGTPTEIYATADVIFSVMDATAVVAGTTSTVTFTVDAAPIAISATADTTAQSLTVGMPMTAFSPLAPSGSVTPYTYSYTGTLPDDLSFDTSTGVVAGTPTAIYATADVVFSVMDANNVVANTTSTVSFTVGAAAVNISATADTTAQDLTVGTPMASFSPLLASGGTPPYTYSYTGILPAGLSLDTSTGAVTGTPTTDYASADVVFSVKDANNVVASTTSTVSFTVGNWTATGNTMAFRGGHTATTLPNGTVLITGGNSGTTSAELYDSTTGMFTVTGSMLEARTWHTATLLPNGQVLITGGIQLIAGPSIAIASAELYDPATGQFTTTGRMVTDVGRSLHTATLLPNGKVLIYGADIYNSNIYAAAEIYDPATTLFTVTSSVTVPSSSHTATLLTNGKVLIVGGSGRLARAELYDSASGLFTTTGSLMTGRVGHTATLLQSGKVLITGGSNNLASAELYDPTTGLFTDTGYMVKVRSGHTATLLTNGEVLVVGGGANDSAELYK